MLYSSSVFFKVWFQDNHLQNHLGYLILKKDGFPESTILSFISKYCIKLYDTSSMVLSTSNVAMNKIPSLMGIPVLWWGQGTN